MKEMLKKMRLRLRQLYRTLTKQLFRIVIKIILVRLTTTLKGLRKILFTMMMKMRIFPSSRKLKMC